MAKIKTETFDVKRITVYTFDEEGNGIDEFIMKLERPLVLGVSEEDKKQGFFTSLRNIALNLLGSGQLRLPRGTKALHLKTNPVKKKSISCIILFKEDYKNDGDDTTTEDPKGESEA